MSATVGDSIRRRGGGPRRRGPGVRWTRVLPFSLLALAAMFGIGYAIAALFLFPAPPESKGGTPVPRVVGADSAAARQALAAAGLGVAEMTALPDPSQPPGTVVAQDPLPGQQLRPSGTVRLGVSSGPAQVTLPDVSGLPADRAASFLASLGFQVQQQQAPAPSAAGTVIGSDPPAGGTFTLPAAIRLLVSAGPPPPPPDTAAAALDTGLVVLPPPPDTMR